MNSSQRRQLLAQLANFHLAVFAQLGRYDELMNEVYRIATDFSYRIRASDRQDTMNMQIADLPRRLKVPDATVERYIAFFAGLQRDQGCYVTTYNGLSGCCAYDVALGAIYHMAQRWMRSWKQAARDPLVLNVCCQDLRRDSIVRAGLGTATLRAALSAEFALAHNALHSEERQTNRSEVVPQAPAQDGAPATARSESHLTLNLGVHVAAPASPPTTKKRQSRAKASATKRSPAERVKAPPEVKGAISPHAADKQTVPHANGAERHNVAPASPVCSNSFLRKGRGWLLEFEGTSVCMSHSIGLGYIAKVIRQAREPILATALATRGPIGAALAAERPIPVVDDVMIKQANEARRDLDAQIEQAERDNDLSALDRLRQEREAILKTLSSVVNVRGKSRLSSNAPERMRRSVGRAIERAIESVQEEHPALGRHLDESITTGHTIVYQPQRQITWIV